MEYERSERCEECGTHIYQAGERVAGGTYLRVDDGSFQRLVVAPDGILPASFDGHVARYRLAAASCVCERRAREGAATEQPRHPFSAEARQR
jgi:hypothetical protein